MDRIGNMARSKYINKMVITACKSSHEAGSVIASPPSGLMVGVRRQRTGTEDKKTIISNNERRNLEKES